MVSRAFKAAVFTLSLSFGACNKQQEKPQTQDTPVQHHAGAAHEDKYNLCFHGCPEGTPAEDREIDRPVYALANNPRTKFADWVAYVVSMDTIGGTKKRVWHTDPDLPENETLSPADYKGVREALGMDRGHQAPLASLTRLSQWEEADYLSNITPQASALNEGPWERLEQAERNLAKRHLTVFSVTGPLYEREMPKLPHAHLDHTIPSGYWKVVAIEQDNDVEVAAFIMDQTMSRDADFCATAVTVRTVETRSHRDLEPGLDAAKQEQLETTPGRLLRALGCGR